MNVIQTENSSRRFSLLKKFSPVVVIVLALVGLPSISRADATWVGDTSQDWNNAANWSSDPANPTGNFFINTATAGVYPIVSANSAFTPVDIIIGDAQLGGASRSDCGQPCDWRRQLAHSGKKRHWNI